MFGNTHYREGGTRGGQDQFKWDKVKGDKHRENYLGHSVMAPSGRWQKGKDLLWYAHKSQSQAKELEEEQEMIRRSDQQLLAKTFSSSRAVVDDSYAGIFSSSNGQKLNSIDSKQLFQRGRSERQFEDIERIKGVGTDVNQSDLTTLTAEPKKKKSKKHRSRSRRRHHSSASRKRSRSRSKS